MTFWDAIITGLISVATGAVIGQIIFRFGAERRRQARELAARERRGEELRRAVERVSATMPGARSGEQAFKGRTIVDTTIEDL